MTDENEKLRRHADHKDATLEDVMGAVVYLTNEVVQMRAVIDPRQRLWIIAISAFLGGVFTNLILWLLGMGTFFGLHHNWMS